MSWTAAERAFVLEQWRAGKTGSTIAAMTGRTRNAVLGFIYRSSVDQHNSATGHPPRKKWCKWTAEENLRLQEAWPQYATVKQVALAVGQSYDSVLTRAKVLNLPRKSRPTRYERTQPLPRLTQKAYLFDVGHRRPNTVRIVDVPDFSVLPVDPVPTHAKPLLELGTHDCRWPFGEPPNIVFCGEPQMRGTSYCEHHYHRSVTPPAVLDPAGTEPGRVARVPAFFRKVA